MAYKQHVSNLHGNRVSFEWAGLGDVGFVLSVFIFEAPFTTAGKGPSKGQTQDCLNKYRVCVCISIG